MGPSCTAIAREFRSGAASNIDAFSPTSPLSFIKLLVSLSVTMGLMISVMDISDAFLQLVQKDFVVIHGSERSLVRRFDLLEVAEVSSRAEKCRT